jgi:ribosomal protein S18 acetylase RimI-like enzyme
MQTFPTRPRLPTMTLDLVLADPLLPAHAAALVHLLDDYASGLTGGGVGLSDFVKQNLPGELARRADACIVLAFVDDQPAGLIIAFEGFSTFQCRPLLNIHDLVVATAYRGRGLAKALMAKIEEIARQRHYCKITLEVLSGNTIAQALYHKMGYAGYELDPAMGQALFWEKKLI